MLETPYSDKKSSQSSGNDDGFISKASLIDVW